VTETRANGQTRVLDVHAHIPETLFDHPLADGGYAVADDLAARVQLMDRAGINASVLMAPGLYERPKGVADTRRLNDCLAWYRDSHAERFPVALGTLDPLHGRDAGLEEIHRLATQLQLDGVVWDHYRQGTGTMSRGWWCGEAKPRARVDLRSEACLKYCGCCSRPCWPRRTWDSRLTWPVLQKRAACIDYGVPLPSWGRVGYYWHRRSRGRRVPVELGPAVASAV
jgi:hypothetical protein